MRLRTVTLFVAVAAVLLAACSSSPTVAEVNGETITAADVDALTAESTDDDAHVPGDPFRALLGLIIENIALRIAAEEEFGLTGLNDPDRLATRIADPPDREVSVFLNIEANPELTQAYAEGAAEYFTIRDAVLGEILTEEGLDTAAIDAAFEAWRVEVLDAADVIVRSQVGLWGGSGAGVLPPP